MLEFQISHKYISSLKNQLSLAQQLHPIQTAGFEYFLKIHCGLFFPTLVYWGPSFIFLKFSNFGFSTILNSFFQIGVVTTVLFDTCAELCRYMGRLALGLGFITLLTGITQLGERDGFDHVKSLQAALFAWFLLITGLVIYIEMCRTRFLLTLLYYHNFLCSVCKFPYCGSHLTVIKSTLC